MVKLRNTTFQSDNLKEGYHMGGLDVNARIILKGYRLDSCGPAADFCDRNNETSCYITAGEFY
jgi:hypothetical protein